MGRMSSLRRALHGFAGVPSLIHVNHGSALSVAFTKIAAGEQLAEDDVRAAFGIDIEAANEAADMLAAPQIIPAGPGKAVAVVSMQGIALYDIEYQPYVFSTKLFKDTINNLAADTDIGTIVILCNSPGGVVTGVPEAADALLAAAKKKTVLAVVDPLCASAAYWICSQATQIVAVPSADIGSVGVFMLHVDYSGMLSQIGMKPTFIFAGKYKVEGNPYEPLGAEAQAYLQGEVDDTYQQFLAAVARGRQIDVTKAEANFGQGRTMAAADAKKAKMIDVVASVQATLAKCGVPMDSMDSRRGRRIEASVEQSTEQASEQAGSSTSLNRGGEDYANSLISSGSVDKNSDWSFTADDGNALLGKDGDDWDSYGKAHLGKDTSQDSKTKAAWKYPFAKGGKLYRSALTAIKQRASQQGDATIESAADGLLRKIDGKKKDSSSYRSADAGEHSAITITKVEKADGGSELYAGAFPQRVVISADLLAESNEYMAVDGDVVTFSVANGIAEYLIVGVTADSDFVLVLVSSTFEPFLLPEAAAAAVTGSTETGGKKRNKKKNETDEDDNEDDDCPDPDEDEEDEEAAAPAAAAAALDVEYGPATASDYDPQAPLEIDMEALTRMSAEDRRLSDARDAERAEDAVVRRKRIARRIALLRVS